MAKSNCEDCFYRRRLGSEGFCCHYIFMTNQRRPCPPGDECTVKVPRKVMRKRKRRVEDA